MTKRRTAQLKLEILPQPDDTSCGPTCLHAVYSYWGDKLSLDSVADEIEPLPGGGTLAVSLACHALRRGYRAEIYTYNLQLFDPTWFDGAVDLAERLRSQRKHKRTQRLKISTDAYLEYLQLGGTVRLRSSGLIDPPVLESRRPHSHRPERDLPLQLRSRARRRLRRCARRAGRSLRGTERIRPQQTPGDGIRPFPGQS